MNRGLTAIVWILLGAALGYWAGVSSGSGSSVPVIADEQELHEPENAPIADVDPAPSGSRMAAWVQARDWYRIERHLSELSTPLPEEEADTLLAGLQANVNKYDSVAMRRILRLYLDGVPDDVTAQFLLSDLQQLEGMPESALDTLFSILNGPFDAETHGRARREADRIVRLIDTRLRARGALSEREAFWRHVSQQYPVSDYYRYEWARSLAGLERWASARRILRETGDSDVSQETLDELEAFIDVGEQGLNFRRDGDRLLGEVSRPGGYAYTLLVDTGANVTSLSLSALRGLQARRLADTVQVRTAGGIVATAVYQVPELEVQGRLLTDLRVLELPVEIPGLDGLLGTDVLDRLDWSVDNL